MKLYNKTKLTYQESFVDTDGNVKFINLEPNCAVEVDRELAEKWLKIDGIEEFVEPKELKAVEDSLKAEIEKLKAENDKLKNTNVTKPKTVTKSKKK